MQRLTSIASKKSTYACCHNRYFLSCYNVEDARDDQGRGNVSFYEEEKSEIRKQYDKRKQNLL